MKLYNGEIELQFSEAAHRYKVNGQYVEGVTTLLSKVISKDGLVPWAANLVTKYIQENCGVIEDLPEPIYSVSETTLQEARVAHLRKKTKGADVGSIVHKFIEGCVNSRLNQTPKPKMPEDKQAYKAAEAWLKWVADSDIKFIKSEVVVYSKQHNYCGTADIIFELNGKRYLGDWKTSDPKKEYKNGYTGKLQAYSEHFVQIGAYDVAYSEEFPDDKFDAHMVIYITKTGQLHTFETDNTERSKKLFINAVNLSRGLREIELMKGIK